MPQRTPFVRCSAATAVVLLTLAGSAGATETTAAEHRPDVVQLTAVVRDFRAAGPEAHPDFTLAGASTRTNVVAPTLSADGKPMLMSRTGRRVQSGYTDAAGREIHPDRYDPAMGDRKGVLAEARDTDAEAVVATRTGFEQWFRDVPGVNRSASMPFMLFYEPSSGTYVFDSSIDAPYAQRGGYFPVDGQLMGDDRAHNYGFTTEMSASFVYDGTRRQTITFSGDNDAFVYVDGMLVLEVCNAEENTTQTVDLSRLPYMEDGERYELRVFHAERRCCASNMRLETTLAIEAGGAADQGPTISAVETDR